MTQEEIIRMAREAGFYGLPVDERLERFAAIVAERTLTNQKSRYYQNGYEAGQHDEREACAKVCDEHGLYGAAPARDIRARGEK